MELSEKQKKYLKNVPDIYKKGVEVSFTVPKQRSVAIKAKCLDCSGFQRTEVRDCTITTCSLWLVRPYQSATGDQNLAVGDEFADCDD